MNILENYKCEAVLCRNGEKCSDEVIPGKWTLIYDQAFNIELDNGMRFISNFRFNLKSSESKDPVKDAASTGIKKFSSISSGSFEMFDS